MNPATHEASSRARPSRCRLVSSRCSRRCSSTRPALSRARLEERLYGWEDQVESNAVEVHVHALRRKLGTEWVKTLRGVGYMVPRRT